MRKDIGKLVISFDDGELTDYTIAHKELRRRGLAGCSYVFGGRIPGTGKLLWSHARAMKAKGHEIECHGYLHRSRQNMTAQEIISDMLNNNDAFVSGNLSAPQHHALPFGWYNSEVLDATNPYRKTIRTTSGSSASYPVNTKESFETDKVLHAKSFDCSTEDDFNEVKDYLDFVEANLVVGIIFGHTIVNEPEPYKGLESYFVKTLDYILEKKIEVISIERVIDALELLAQN